MVDPVLLDTNIVIDYLAGIRVAEDTVLNCLDSAISVISWIEVLAGISAEQQEATLRFLRTLTQMPLTPKIASEAAQVRRSYRLKLPDAIILATAYVEGRILLTRNTEEFGAIGRSVRFPYKL